MPRKNITENLMSAGGVVYRPNGDGQLEVAICGLRHPESWRLPKGTPDPGETVLQTALREVREETGLHVVSNDYIDSIEYWFVRAQDGKRCHKVVHFYLMKPVGGDISQHDHEFDIVKWAPVDDACDSLTYESEVDIVRKGISMVGQQVRTEKTAR